MAVLGQCKLLLLLAVQWTSTSAKVLQPSHHSNVVLPDGYILPPAITTDWIQYQGRSKQSFEIVVDGIRKYKNWQRTLLQRRNITVDDFSEPVGILGGVVMTSRQIQRKLDQISGRVKRQIISTENPEQLWPTTVIRYRIDEQLFTAAEQQVIDSAAAYWNNNTCMTLQRHPADATFNEGERTLFVTKYLNPQTEQHDNSTCTAVVGRSTETDLVQPVYLGSRCLDTVYMVAAHEFGHAMGLHHQHQRTDRNQYVNVHSSRLKTGSGPNYDVLEEGTIETKGLPYDYASVMHYSSKDFAATFGSLTMEPVDELMLTTIGQRTEISFLDARIINIAYCSNTCSQSDLVCQNSGYVDPVDCTVCRCPDPYTGRLCDELKSGSEGCSPLSGRLSELADSEPVCLSSPNYAPNTEDAAYEVGQSCTWMIKVPEGCSTKMWFTTQQFWPSLAKLSNGACVHYVEIRADGPSQRIGERICGDANKFSQFKYSEESPLTSDAREIPVTFRAYPTVFSYHWQQRLGFELCYAIADPSCLPAISSTKATSSDSSTTTTSTSTSTSSSSSSSTTTSSPKCNSKRKAASNERTLVYTVQTTLAGKSFDQQLTDKSSEAYKTVENEVRGEVLTILCFHYDSKLNNVDTITFSKGSLKADFDLEFILADDETNPNTNTIARLVDRSSLFNNTVSLTKQASATVGPAVIVGVVLGTGCLVISIAMAITMCCIRQQRNTPRRPDPRMRIRPMHDAGRHVYVNQRPSYYTDSVASGSHHYY